MVSPLEAAAHHIQVVVGSVQQDPSLQVLQPLTPGSHTPDSYTDTQLVDINPKNNRSHSLWINLSDPLPFTNGIALRDYQHSLNGVLGVIWDTVEPWGDEAWKRALLLLGIMGPYELSDALSHEWGHELPGNRLLTTAFYGSDTSTHVYSYSAPGLNFSKFPFVRPHIKTDQYNDHEYNETCFRICAIDGVIYQMTKGGWSNEEQVHFDRWRDLYTSGEPHHFSDYLRQTLSFVGEMGYFIVYADDMERQRNIDKDADDFLVFYNLLTRPSKDPYFVEGLFLQGKGLSVKPKYAALQMGLRFLMDPHTYLGIQKSYLYIDHGQDYSEPIWLNLAGHEVSLPFIDMTYGEDRFIYGLNIVSKPKNGLSFSGSLSAPLNILDYETERQAILREYGSDILSMNEAQAEVPSMKNKSLAGEMIKNHRRYHLPEPATKIRIGLGMHSLNLSSHHWLLPEVTVIGALASVDNYDRNGSELGYLLQNELYWNPLLALDDDYLGKIKLGFQLNISKNDHVTNGRQGIPEGINVNARIIIPLGT
ncbi:MAG: hypothetical protein ACD_73C00611G0003 [uncultured bacterium]|nr:MAG: hypothetical protein ACD_73C00611G0003 [uncultured bacterium]